MELTALTMAIGILLGIVLAVMRLSGNPIMSWAASWYVWLFRGTPTLVQLIFWFNLASLFPRLSLGVPFGGPKFLSASSNDLISPFTAALLGLGLDEAAYMAEIVRGGILSADPGQVDASKALGMRSLYTLRRVFLPQAMRSIVPATGDQTIGNVRGSREGRDRQGRQVHRCAASGPQQTVRPAPAFGCRFPDEIIAVEDCVYVTLAACLRTEASMIIPLPLIVVPTKEQVDALEAFAALAKARIDLLRLHALVPTPSLASRLRADDHVLVRQYESLVRQGLEAAAVLALYRARPVRRAGEHRAA